MEKKLKVLIAENTAEFGVPCSNLLKTYGMDVVLTPKEGSRLFTEVKSVRPDVLIMDAFMPKMDALGVLKQLETMEARSRPLTMVMSTGGNEKLEGELLSSGASYYLLKPVDMDMLAERVVQLTGWRKASGLTKEQGSYITDTELEMMGDRNNSSARRSRSHKGLSLSADVDNSFGQGFRNGQCRYKAALSHRRKAV